MNLTTQYAGLTLRNPIIVGSSGLNSSVSNIKEFEEKGAGAVVLKSIFEEEITLEYEHILNEAEKSGMSDSNLDYFDYKIKDENLQKYLDLIKAAKDSVFIPIIASINASSSYEWIYYAKRFEEAGADAIELNMFVLPTELSKTCEQNRKYYFDVVKKIKKQVSIPVILKISPYFSNLAATIQELSETGIDAMVLFNRFFSPDIDIDSMKLLSKDVFTHPSDNLLSLRWLALMSGRISCDLAASTGVHDGEAVIKQLLSGASAVQMVSAIYQNGAEHIQAVLDDLERWMEKKGFETINDFKGKMNQSKIENPAIYERMQFMKYFGGYQPIR